MNRDEEEKGRPMQRSPARGGRRTRDDAKRETREALITAGISAFSEEGLDAPSLDAICSRAGYTRGAFYVHFADRDDFLIAVMSSLLEGFLDAVIATGDAALDLQKTIDTFVAAVAAGAFPMRGSVAYHQLMAACARSPRVRDRFRGVIAEGTRRVAIAIREGQGVGTVRADVDADHVALVLTALTLGVQGLLDVEYSFDVVSAGVTLSALLKPGV